jgi:NADP-dependent alcohol dehydrogenase
LNVKTRLSDHGIGKAAIAEMVAQLKRHGMTAPGEHRNMDIEVSRRVFEAAF